MGRKYEWEPILADYKAGQTREQLHRKYGVTESHLTYMLTRSGLKPRSVSETRLRKSGGYRKLIRTSKPSITRLVSIPGQLLKEAGLNPKKALLGIWKVDPAYYKGVLTLHIKEE